MKYCLIVFRILLKKFAIRFVKTGLSQNPLLLFWTSRGTKRKIFRSLLISSKTITTNLQTPWSKSEYNKLPRMMWGILHWKFKWWRMKSMRKEIHKKKSLSNNLMERETRRIIWCCMLTGELRTWISPIFMFLKDQWSRLIML